MQVWQGNNGICVKSPAAPSCERYRCKPAGASAGTTSLTDIFSESWLCCDTLPWAALPCFHDPELALSSPSRSCTFRSVPLRVRPCQPTHRNCTSTVATRHAEQFVFQSQLPGGSTARNELPLGRDERARPQSEALEVPTTTHSSPIETRRTSMSELHI